MKYIVIILFLSSHLLAQQIEIKLNELSALDENFVHVVVLSDKPSEKIIIPEGITSPKYLNLFYSWDSKNDEKISVLVCQNDTADILYVDLNNDENLTNDGSPIIFPLSSNVVYFDIIDLNDLRQKTHLILYRKPEVSDSTQQEFTDEDGNLLSNFTKFWNVTVGITNFKGEMRTFYFDNRMGLRRGNIILGERSIQIGLFDYSNNGIFNDENDLFLIDLNRDEKLDYMHDEEIFKLNDIVRIQNENYKLSFIDKYGLHLVLEKTSEESTKYFTRWDYEKNYNENKYSLDQEFWEYTFTDINGNLVDMKEYKGAFLLINFWGEWCLPCREEIPDLVKTYKKHMTNLNIISFIKTNNIAKVKDLIVSSNMKWNQIILKKEIEDKFKIRGYPTNLLVYPDGKTYLKQGQIKEDFFDVYIK